MEFSIETSYDQKALTAMVRALRKTLGKKRSRRTRNFGIFTAALGILFMLSAVEVNLQLIATLAVVIVIILALVFQNSINAFYSRKMGLPGLNKSTVTFYETHYHSSTDLGASDFRYESIQCIIDAGEYWIFAFGPRHGQVYEKRTLTGGSAEEFEHFIQKITGLQLIVA